MWPPIAPLGLEYVGAAARAAGVPVELLDLALAPEPAVALECYFQRRSPRLIGITFRNVDDAFWPSGTSFVPDLTGLIAHLRRLTDAPIVVGGVGFSIVASLLVGGGHVDLGIRGDGEDALVMLYTVLDGQGRFEDVPGLVWREGATLRANAPAWPMAVAPPPTRDVCDNREYFRRGGQAGVETKRGCPRACIYCADPLAKGPQVRARAPGDVADEIEALLRQGIDVLHLCDGEINVPRAHALDVCAELTRRGLGGKISWYCYAAVQPFDAELAVALRRAGCVGINFTGDAGNDTMLASYRHPHVAADLARTVGVCRDQGLLTMVDLLLGGPGETPDTAAQTIDLLRRVGPDCVGAAVGMRLYPGTPVTRALARRSALETLPGVHRSGTGPVDLLQPVFFIAPALGSEPGRLVRDLIAGDPRFFPPADAGAGPATRDHNYNANAALAAAIGRGARGAYWDILRKLPPNGGSGTESA